MRQNQTWRWRKEGEYALIQWEVDIQLDQPDDSLLICLTGGTLNGTEFGGLMIWTVSDFWNGLQVPKDRDQSKPWNFRAVGM